MVWALEVVFIIFLGLGAVAFITLLERKILGLSQVRLGPNKVSFLGLLQPVSDGVKLLLKETFFISNAQSVLFLVSPSLTFVLFITMWVVIIPWAGGLLSLKYSALIFFSTLGLGAYAVILTGLGSTSGFSKLGGLRGMLQSLSFEVALILTFMSVLFFFKTFSMKVEEAFGVEIMTLWGVLWLILSLMETNRAPFDLLEGESELISGFNIEIGSLLFVFLFLSEYGMMMLMALIFSVSLAGKVQFVCFLFISGMLFIRSCFPRLRYDIMMTFMWMCVLPASIFVFSLASFLF